MAGSIFPLRTVTAGCRCRIGRRQRVPQSSVPLQSPRRHHGRTVVREGSDRRPGMSWSRTAAFRLLRWPPWPMRPTPSSSASHGDVSALYGRPIRLPEARGNCPVSDARPVSINWGGITGGIPRLRQLGTARCGLVMAEESLPISPAVVDGHVVTNGAVAALGLKFDPGLGGSQDRLALPSGLPWAAPPPR